MGDRLRLAVYVFAYRRRAALRRRLRRRVTIISVYDRGRIFWRVAEPVTL